MKNKQSRALCPGCSELVVNAVGIIEDSRGRPWHSSCAIHALANHFRTPLDLAALAGQRIEFEIPGEHASLTLYKGYDCAVLRSPRDFILRAVQLGDDTGLYGLLVGCNNVFSQAPTTENAFFGRDFKNGLLEIGAFAAQTGLDITFQFLKSTITPRIKLIGELFDPKTKPRQEYIAAPVCTGITSKVVAPGAAEEIKVGCRRIAQQPAK